MVFLELLDL